MEPMRQCECEDVTHFDDGAPERLAQRYQAHVYGKARAVCEVKTTFGPFAVCQECYDRGHCEVDSDDAYSSTASNTPLLSGGWTN